MAVLALRVPLGPGPARLFAAAGKEG